MVCAHPLRAKLLQHLVPHAVVPHLGDQPRCQPQAGCSREGVAAIPPSLGLRDAAKSEGWVLWSKMVAGRRHACVCVPHVEAEGKEAD